MRVTVFGTGYVGLVQAAVFAEAGTDVTCVDLDEAKIERLRRGESVIFEPGLTTLVREGIDSGRLRFTTDAAEGVRHGSIIFIAVGTPPDEDGAADLSHVLTVASTIARHMDEERLVVIKSTVPVGTNDKVRAAIAAGLAERGLGHLVFDVASNPEFLKEGSAVADCSKPDRIIVGTGSERSEAQLRQLYAPFNRNRQKMIVMDARSAELTKYAANCILATKISFMNEMANLADRLGADIENVRLGIGSDPRIGYDFIYPGMGYGGSCFPKDVKAMIRLADDIAFDPVVLKAVEERNKHQKNILVDKILSHFGGDVRGKTFALWGLSFKPNTDDMREAPARIVMEALWEKGADIRAFDPKALDECRRLYPDHPGLTLCATQHETLEGADALVICTEWKVFRTPDFDRLKRMLKAPVIFDGRNIYDPLHVGELGFIYHAVGRSARPAATPVETEERSR